MKAREARVIFMGYSIGGGHTMQTLIELEAHLVGIILPKSAPPEKNEEVLRLAGEQIPVFYSNKPGAELIRTVSALKPDLIIVNSFPYLLPSEFIEIPSMGCINLHGAYLPSYRGAHVLQWAIINGETETGITLHHIDAGMDTGDIIAQKKVPIMYEDTAVTLRERIYTEGDKLLRSLWHQIENGTAPRIPQDDSESSVYHKRIEKDGKIDWTKSCFEIHNLVRAMVPPWPGAFCAHHGAEVKIHYGAVSKENFFKNSIPALPGKIVSVSSFEVVVECGTGFYSVLVASFNLNSISDFHTFFKEGDVLQ